MTVEINMNKTRVKKKYKRYFSHLAGTGRDTGHREMEVSEQKFADNWCQTFGHKWNPEPPHQCLTCHLEKNYTRSLKGGADVHSNKGNDR